MPRLATRSAFLSITVVAPRAISVFAFAGTGNGDNLCASDGAPAEPLPNQHRRKHR